MWTIECAEPHKFLRWGVDLKFIACTRFRLRDMLARAKCMKSVSLGAKRTPPKGGFTSRGAKRRVRFEKKSRTLRVHSHAHAHAYTCACRRACTHAHTNVRAGERAHMRTHACARIAPFGCMKNITARSHLRTHVIVSKSCERRVRHEKEKTNRAMRMHLRCIR